MKTVPTKDLERLLKDSREMNECSLNELCYIRSMLNMMVSGIDYNEAIEHIQSQMWDRQNQGE